MSTTNSFWRGVRIEGETEASSFQHHSQSVASQQTVPHPLGRRLLYQAGEGDSEGTRQNIKGVAFAGENNCFDKHGGTSDGVKV